MSIVEDKLKNKKTEIKRIDKKVEEEQITPTSNEKRISTISYRRFLPNIVEN